MKYVLLLSLLLTGCANGSPIDLVIPTVVPPLADELGYNIPDVKGVTTVGMVKGFIETERLRLQALDASADLTLSATSRAVDGILALLAALGIPGAYKYGERRKRPEDFSEAEYTKALFSAPPD